MRQTRPFPVVVLLLLVAVSLPAHAGIKDRPYSLCFNFGGAQPALNDSAQIWSVSSAYGGLAQYMVSPQIGIVLSARHATIYNDSASTSPLKISRDRANRKWSLIDIAIGSRLYLSRRKGFSPYLTLTGDLIRWKMAGKVDGTTLRAESRSGSPIDYSATEFGITGGIGIEKLFGDRIGFTISADFSYLTGANTDFAQSIANTRSRGLATLTAGMWVHFGGKPRNLLREFEGRDKAEPPQAMRRVHIMEIDRLTGDTLLVERTHFGKDRSFVTIERGNIEPDEDDDGDGVRDRFDKYPDTPDGALVDLDGRPHDSDGDGVMDGIDRCPDTPRAARAALDETGCPLDTDRDGVPDYLDRCPDTSTRSQVDTAGCPVDSDGDGVSDDLDSCPDTPREMPMDRYGCPDLPLIFYTRILRPSFRAGEVNFTPAVRLTLDSIAVLMRMFAEPTATISGYTDDVNPADINRIVSQERADAVLQYLISKGVAAKRVQAAGQGEAHFIDTNRTEAGRERNRRIEIEFHYP